MRKSSDCPIYPQFGNPLLTMAPACTALTVSSDAVGAVDPTPRGTETEVAEAVPAEVRVVAEGKATVLATPMATAVDDGAGAAAEVVVAEGSR